MSTINKSLYAAALNLLLIAGGSAYSSSALALPITWTLQDVTFTDGGTASGNFSLNQYGYVSDFSITTTMVGSFTGNTYAVQTSISPTLDH